MSKMRLLLSVVLIGFVLAGCAGQSERDGVDTAKAAQFNAELGLRYMVQGKDELAMEKLQRALEFNPDLAIAHHYMAELYRRLGKKGEADTHYRRAMELAPNDSTIKNNYGIFLCGEKRYDEGEKYVLQALDDPVYTERAQGYENLGHCMHDKGDMTKAEKYFRRALQYNPRLPGSLQAMAEISLNEKNYISARAFLQRYEAVAPHTAESLWLGIQIERVLGNKDALSSYALSLKNNFPDSPQTQLYLNSQHP